MGILRRFEPRNPALASNVLCLLTVVATTTTIVSALTSPVPQVHADLALQCLACASLLAVVTALKLRPAPLLWAAYPFLTVGVITLLDLVTLDASVPAQVFFFFPVLYAGAQLRGAAAIAVCAATIGGVAVVGFGLMPFAKAVVDVFFAAATLASNGALLIIVGRRMDSLIAQLERQAATDPLTGLLSRRALDQAALAALGRTSTDLGTALLVMDVDHFKTINDRLGHPAGDAVLRQLADVLVHVNRRHDVISRMGGDEIAVLLPDCSLEVAALRAQDILTAVRGHEFAVAPAGGGVLPITLSIGVAHLPSHAPDVAGLYQKADEALYEAKRSGRNQVAVADGVALLSS